MEAQHRKTLANIKQASFSGPFEASGNPGNQFSATNKMLQNRQISSQSHSESSHSLNFRGRHYQDLGVHADDPNYGCPVAGSRTEYRGKQAGVHVSSEIVELCDIIQQIGTKQADGTITVTFGPLFEFYTRISNKLVGMLMRARKQGLVEFEGEMLFQRRDDHVKIHLIKFPEELLQEISQSKEELRHHSAKK